MSEALSTVARGKEEGVIYLSSWGSVYTVTQIDADRLKKYSRNVYGAGVASKHRNLIFNEKYTIEVTNENGEPDEALAKHLMKMCDAKDVRLWSQMRLAWTDVFWFGMSFFNPVWDYGEEMNPQTGEVRKTSEYILKKLRHLPPESFSKQPYGRVNKYADILPGVTLNPTTGEIEYWQTLNNIVDAIPVTGNFSGRMLQTPLKHIFTVSDPSTGELAGDPIVRPIAPIITMLDFTWQAQMQKVNRIGAPILFLEITDATGDDIEYGQQFLANWGKNTAYQLRPNMKLIIPDLKDNSSAIETINALAKMVVDYFTPASLIAKDGTLIGGSSASEQELLLSYIRSTHTWITESFELLLQTYLEANLFRGYTVKIIIPSPSIDKSEIWMKQALALGKLVDAGLTVADENEFRDLLERDPLEPERVAELIEKREKYRAAKLSLSQDEGLQALMKARLAIDASKEELDPGDLLDRKQYRRTIQMALGLFTGDDADGRIPGSNEA